MLQRSITSNEGFGRDMQRIEPVIGTIFFFGSLVALLAINCAARIAIDACDFDGLPQPIQID